jgi:hypothetical protein
MPSSKAILSTLIFKGLEEVKNQEDKDTFKNALLTILILR